MLFSYKAITKGGEAQDGMVDAGNIDAAINSLQRRGLIISKIHPADESNSFMGYLNRLSIFNSVSGKDLVILSRQMSTLFEARVSALQIFKLLASEAENHTLRKALSEIADDLQGGSSISTALSKHPNIFSDFYVNMVKSGEESGKLDETFGYLADYIDRTYEVVSRARNALIYPLFVVITFIGVMILMFTVVIPKISAILIDTGQDLPIYTKIVLGVSSFFVNYGVFLAILVIISAFFLWRYVKTAPGKLAYDNFKIQIPYVGNLYKKLYLSRIADTMHTMILSGVSMVRALEITSSVVDNEVYKEILEESLDDVRGGSSLSNSLAKFEQIPNIMVQMIKVGEETGELGHILDTMAKFYRREVNNAVDTLVSLIEPVMIVFLGVGVGVLLAAVIMPIYNIASTGF